MNQIRQYDCYLTFNLKSGEVLQAVRDVFNEAKFEVELSESSLEFEAAGRDADRLVVEVFKAVAQLLVDAEGELKCEIDDEESDPHFEFYFIRSGRLLIQKGRVTRDEEISVA